MIPNIVVGKEDLSNYDWRKESSKEEEIIDDTEDDNEKASPAVIAALGFDPDELDDESK